MSKYHDHRSDCPFKFASLDVCDCVEHNMLDRIEALTAERDAWKEQHAAEALGLHVQMQRAEAAEAKLAKAVEGLDKAAALIEDRHVVHMTSKGRNPKDYISDWSLIAKEVRITLAEIEGEKT